MGGSTGAIVTGARGSIGASITRIQDSTGTGDSTRTAVTGTRGSFGGSVTARGVTRVGVIGTGITIGVSIEIGLDVKELGLTGACVTGVGGVTGVIGEGGEIGADLGVGGVRGTKGLTLTGAGLTGT